MSHLDDRSWKEFKGLGLAKIAQLKAALEIGRRFREDEASAGKQKIGSAKDVVDILMPQMRDLKTEVFKVVYLDSNNGIIEITDAAAGTVDHARPIVREIAHAALQRYASTIVCAHNHPSGRIEPSAHDKELTNELRNACKYLSIKLLDHLIVGDNEYFSFKERGLL